MKLVRIYDVFTYFQKLFWNCRSPAFSKLQIFPFYFPLYKFFSRGETRMEIASRVPTRRRWIFSVVFIIRYTLVMWFSDRHACTLSRCPTVLLCRVILSRCRAVRADVFTQTPLLRTPIPANHEPTHTHTRTYAHTYRPKSLFRRNASVKMSVRRNLYVAREWSNKNVVRQRNIASFKAMSTYDTISCWYQYVVNYDPETGIESVPFQFWRAYHDSIMPDKSRKRWTI